LLAPPHTDIGTARPSYTNRAILVAAAGFGGLLAAVAATGLTGSFPLGIAIGLVTAWLTARFAAARRLLVVDERACSRPLLTLSAITAAVAWLQLARLAVFMVDPANVGYSTLPSSRWEVRHSCLTAYYVAANAADDAPDIYADALYSLPDSAPGAPRRPRTLGAFNIDVFEYPPTFLLLPRAAQLVTSDFNRLRPLWFAFNGAVLLLALVVISRSLDPAIGTRALLLSPLVVLALPTLGPLQKGNVQLIVIGLAMIGMRCFQRGQFAIGGAALGFAIVSKLYPGLLVIYLIARREWRAVTWTAALSAVFAALVLLDVGAAPYAAFVEHLPKLMSGEAFPAFRNPAATASNMSIPGLVFKLKLLGFSGMSFEVAKVVGWLYTVFATGVVIVVARRTRGVDGAAPFVWLAILILATLRSPFLPQGYGVFPAVWLLTLLAAAAAPTWRTLATLLVIWLVFHFYVPPDWTIGVHARIAIALLPQTAMIALMAIALRRYASPTSASVGVRL